MTLTLTGDAPPAATVIRPYSHAFEPDGGSPPYTFAITSGVLPPGLTLDPTTGTITGTPTGEIFIARLLRLDANTANDEVDYSDLGLGLLMPSGQTAGCAVERVWESGLVRTVNDFDVRMIRVGNLDVWARGNGELLTQVFGPDKQLRRIPPLSDASGEPVTLSDAPGTMYQEKFDLAHVENWTAQFSTRLVDAWFELSEFIGYQKADLANR